MEDNCETRKIEKKARKDVNVSGALASKQEIEMWSMPT